MTEIRPCPEHGIHQWLLSSARLLSFGELSDQEICDRLYQLTRNVRRHVPDREIVDAIKRVRQANCEAHACPALTQTTFVPEALARVAAQLPPVDESYLLARSPIDPRTVNSDVFLRAIFRPGEKVIIFSDEFSQGQLLWNAENPRARELLCSFATGKRRGVWFLTNPVDGLYHDNPRQGTLSRRSEEAITSWRHMILESDEAPPGQWLSLLCQIRARTLAIYSSARKSLHSLLLLQGIGTKADWDAAVRERGVLSTMCALGACRGSLRAVQLSRLPGCRREETGRIQELLFLNSNPQGIPISQLPIVR